MTTLTPELAAKPDDMRVILAFLAASMIDGAPDIVEALDDVPAATMRGDGGSAAAAAERAIEVLDQPGLDDVVEIVEALPRGSRRPAARRHGRRPARRRLSSHGGARPLRPAGAPRSGDPGDGPGAAGLSRGERRLDHDDRIRQRSVHLHDRANARTISARSSGRARRSTRSTCSIRRRRHCSRSLRCAG